jgi:fructose-1,6-bisphosphatase/inositol monophosphatase family enzyme
MELPSCISRKDFLLSVIEEIGNFQMQYFGQEIEFETKSSVMDFVSFVDKESEQIFREELRKKFPQDTVM